MKLLRLILLPLLVSGIFSGCAINQSDIRGFNLISVQQEKELGDKFAVEIEKERKVVKDPAVQGYVDRLGRRLLTGVREVSFNYDFKVVEDDGVNAFAVPGGHVYIQTGLIKAASSESELVAVVAHEINHVVARHGTRQLTQQYGYTFLLQLLLGDNPGQLSQLAAALFGKAGTMAYSRGMESQADYLGVETMYKAGYNPEGMVTFFAKLDAMSQGTPGTVTQFFSSHPLTSERIQNVRNEIAKLPPRSWPKDDASELSKIKARLK